MLVNDAYNANPASMESALAALVERAGGARTVAVLGHMAELGPDAPRWHAEVGDGLRAPRRRRRDRRRRARGLCDGRRGRASGTPRPTSRPRPSCCRRVLQPGDFVLLKGSRSAGIERLAEVAL